MRWGDKKIHEKTTSGNFGVDHGDKKRLT